MQSGEAPPKPSSGAGAPPVHLRAQLRSKEYRLLLLFAAVIGVVVSLASWGFLELVHYIEVGVYTDLPDDLGYDTAPWWWPLPWLALAGVLTAFAIVRLPGRGGHVPAEGLKVGAPAGPIALPGIVLAALATLGLGLVLGPEAPLIAIGAGLAILATRLVKKDAPQQVLGVIAAAGSFAAISSLFGSSPIVAAVLIIEATGLGGATLPLVLLPGLLAAGIGSLVFIGMGHSTGLSTSAYALSPLDLPALDRPQASHFGWTILLAIAAAIVTFVIVELAKWLNPLVASRIYLFTVAAALMVGGLAIAYNQATDQPADAVLFSGQDAFSALFKDAPSLSLWTLTLLLVFKGLAWSISLSSFRGGPTFPALFLGSVAGLLAGHLPGLSETPAVAVLMAATCVSVLKLPLSTIVLVTILTSSAGLAVSPLIVVAVVIAYLTIQSLSLLSETGFRRTPNTAAAGAHSR